MHVKYGGVIKNFFNLPDNASARIRLLIRCAYNNTYGFSVTEFDKRTTSAQISV